MKTICIILTMLICTYRISMAQSPMNDTIRINYEDKVFIDIATPDYENLKHDEQIKTIFQAFQQDLQGITIQVPGYKHYKIIYRPGKTLDFKKLDEEEKYEVMDGKVQPAPDQNIAYIEAQHFHLSAVFTTLEDLKEPDIQQAINAAITKLPYKTRFVRLITFRYANHQLDESAFSNTINSRSLDMLSFQAGVGASLIRNKAVTDISGEIGLVLSKKGVLRNYIYASGNLYYTFGETNAMNISSFLNVGYRYNFYNNPSKTFWLGFEAGFPVHKEGELFKDNLMRVAFNWGIGKNINISPELYINKGFKSAFPGIHIQFGFLGMN